MLTEPLRLATGNTAIGFSGSQEVRPEGVNGRPRGLPEGAGERPPHFQGQRLPQRRRQDSHRRRGQRKTNENTQGISAASTSTTEIVAHYRECISWPMHEN